MDSGIDSQEDGIPDEDDSNVDEELKSLRKKRRINQQRKKSIVTKDIPLGEAGIHKRFEDIGKNKKDKYVEKLGGDEEYRDSSDLDSDDSRDELDPYAIEGVDLPAMRKSKKVTYDSTCEVSIFQLDMIFESATKFRKSVADHAVENKVQLKSLKLRPNEKHRVKVKCTMENCNWELSASIDRDSGNFMIKKYYHVHKCITKIKNKLCTSKVLANKFKDEITSQSVIRIWEIQELVRKKLSLYVGRTICHRAKKEVRERMSDWKMEFARLCDYADMIKQTNLDSSCWIRTNRESPPGKISLFISMFVLMP